MHFICILIPRSNVMYTILEASSFHTCRVQRKATYITSIQNKTTQNKFIQKGVLR